MSSANQSGSAKKLKFIVCLQLIAAMFLLAGTIAGCKDSATEPDISPSDDNTVYTTVEIMPQFPGGDKGLNSFISSTIIYPEMAMGNGIQDRVVVSFVIDKSGTVKDIKTIKGLYEELNNAAIECIKKMPKWAPGKKDGKPVSVLIELPLTFML